MSDSIDFEHLLADLSATFISVSADELNDRIAAATQRLVEFLGFDRSSIFQLNDESGRLETIASWARPGVEPFLAPDTSEFPWYDAQLRAGHARLLPHLPDDLPPEAIAERRHAVAVGLKSILTIPISVAGRLTGVVSFGSVRNYRELSDALVHRVRLIGEIFGNAQARAHAEKKLRQAFAEIQELKDRLQAENTFLREEVNLSHAFGEIIGKSDTLRRVLTQAEQVAPTDSSVLITGETGTGKELISRAIHERSRRRDKPFVAVSCGALPATLIESELFGHEKGAFTGAHTRKIGRFELADGGTLFLDEIGELAADLQPKLLRVLQAGQFERVGSSRTLKVDVRVIAATNRDLPGAVEQGRFRADLYYRLGVFPIHMPALRERPEDIPLLVWFFITEKQSKLGKKITKIAPGVMKGLTAYSWPGNIRELENVIERSLILSPGPSLCVDELALGAATGQGRKTSQSLEAMERAHLLNVLRDCGWKINGMGNAAERLGLNPSTLRFRMKKLGIERA